MSFEIPEHCILLLQANKVGGKNKTKILTDTCMRASVWWWEKILADMHQSKRCLRTKWHHFITHFQGWLLIRA